MPPIVELAGLDLSSPAYGEAYPYFGRVSAAELSEIDRVQLSELRSLLSRVRSNPGSSYRSKDSNRHDYLPPATAKELLLDAYKLQKEMERREKR